jgi:hypothetical protein
MPIPSTIRVNPLDLQKNIVIGVALPFNAPRFNVNYSTKDQIKSNLINLLLTNRGERIMNPDYGADLRSSLFEGINSSQNSILREKIINTVNAFMPEISLTEVNVESDIDNHTINITVNYMINISEKADQVTIQFT